MKRIMAITAVLAATLVGCTEYDAYDSDSGGSENDPSNTVPGYDYGDSLTEDYEYCKDVGNNYEDMGGGSAEDGYSSCLDVLDRLDGYGD